MKFQGFKDEIGYAIGIVSSIFYIGSRTAQLYKNVSILMIYALVLSIEATFLAHPAHLHKKFKQN